MQADPVLRLTSNVIWDRPEPWFGGFSGAEVSADGNQITLITDKSSLVTAELMRANGMLNAIRLLDQRPLRHANARVIKDRHSDSEGLAVGRDGSVYLSFERITRVVRLDPKTGQTTVLPTHPDFARYEINKGLEALAIHPDGMLYTLPERHLRSHKAYPLYAFSNGQWRITHRIPKRGPFLPVGADFDLSGRLYLLERTVTPLGFRSRIRRFDFGTKNLNETTLLTSGPGRFDNFEAISVWTDAAGKTRVTLISDDNFLAIQRTQIAEFVLTE